MDKFTKEEDREYLIDNLKIIDEISDNIILSNEIRMQAMKEIRMQTMKLLFDLTTALYKLDNDIK